MVHSVSMSSNHYICQIDNLYHAQYEIENLPKYFQILPINIDLIFETKYLRLICRIQGNVMSL